MTSSFIDAPGAWQQNPEHRTRDARIVRPRIIWFLKIFTPWGFSRETPVTIVEFNELEEYSWSSHIYLSTNQPTRQYKCRGGWRFIITSWFLKHQILGPRSENIFEKISNGSYFSCFWTDTKIKTVNTFNAFLCQLTSWIEKIKL